MNKALKAACSGEKTPMPNWLKTIIGVLTTLFCGAVMAWAAAIENNTQRLADNSEQNKDRVSILETHFQNDTKRLEKIEKKLEDLAPQQIRIEGKIDLILQQQAAQAKELDDIKEKMQ